jgi:isocitrate dehydrogenase (NAD+)
MVLIFQILQTNAIPKPLGKQVATLVPGDGVGPDLMNSLQDVFTHAGVPVEFEEFFLR